MTTNGSIIRRVFVAAIFLSALISWQARPLAWGAKGHEIIAQVAAERLSGRARKGTKELLGRASLGAASTWADTVRSNHRAHLLLIPLDENDYNADRDCPGDCLLKAIERYAGVLGDFNRPHAERAEALRYVLHLVGDLHQPLHCSDNGDNGGNKRLVYFYGKPTNLHTVWDTGIIGRENLTAEHYARNLSPSLDRGNKGSIGNVYGEGTVVDWALESHRLARGAYQLGEGERLGDDYYRANKPVVDAQLYKAGVRLAKVLNDIFR